MRSPEFALSHSYLKVTTVDAMLQLFDTFVSEPPDFGVQVQWGGLIAFPFNAVIDWPMTTQAGAALFTHPAINTQLKEDIRLLGKVPSFETFRQSPPQRARWLVI
jgi:hypothetical protein